MKSIHLILSLFVLTICSCGSGSGVIEKLRFYDPQFKLPKESRLRTDGFYQIESVTRTLNLSVDTFTTSTTYGFINFFDDGFCRIGQWNGIYRNGQEAFSTVTIDAPNYGWTWGLYKLMHDTVLIETHAIDHSHVFGNAPYYRNELTCILKNDTLFVVMVGNDESAFLYDYPLDSTTSSQTCVGHFTKVEINENRFDNFLKREPEKYLETNKQ